MLETFAQEWARLVARDPAKPALTWYDEAAVVRVELSYATLDNWVSKIANLLVDGLGVGAGDVVTVQLDRDWHEPAACLAAWVAGAKVGAGGELLDADALADVLGFGDRFSGPSAPAPDEFAGAQRLASAWGLEPSDRVLGLVDGWPGWLPALAAGAGAVIWHGLDRSDARRRLASERVTVAVGAEAAQGLGVRVVAVH